jgi:hypothetical protein
MNPVEIALRALVAKLDGYGACLLDPDDITDELGAAQRALAQAEHDRLPFS